MPTKIQDENIRAALPFPAVADTALELVTQAYAAAASGRGFSGLPTGLASLDALLGGLQPGIHILGGEPGAGKTSTALHIASMVARTAGPVVYCSFDEAVPRVFLKVLASRAGLSFTDMTQGNVLPDKVAAAIYQHAPSLERLYFMPDDSRLTVTDLFEQLSDRLTLHKAATGLVVIDYFQIWAARLAAQHGGKGDYRLALDGVLDELRQATKKAGVAVLLLSSQNRSGQDSDKMTSLKESSALEYSADSIMLLTRDNQTVVGNGKKALRLNVRKNRFGPSDKPVSLLLDGPTQCVSELHAQTSNVRALR